MSDEEIDRIAREYIEAQLTIMGRYGSRPELSAERYAELLADVKRPIFAACARSMSRRQRAQSSYRRQQASHWGRRAVELIRVAIQYQHDPSAECAPERARKAAHYASLALALESEAQG